MIKILIVDDREVVRKELKNIFDLTGTIEVVGESANGWEAVQQAAALKPDIVLMDLEMPVMDGIEATRRIKSGKPAPAVMVFTVYGGVDTRQRALQAGADAFVVKGTDLQSLLDLFERILHPLDGPLKGAFDLEPDENQ